MVRNVVRKQLLLIAVALPSLIGSTSIARTIEYYPEGSTTLGSGFDPQNMATVYAVDCLDSDGVEQIDSGGGGLIEGALDIREIKSGSSLLQTLGISISADASSEFASGSASFSDELNISFNENNLVWAATTRIQFGRFRLKNPRANNTLNGITTPEEAVRICGPEIVTQETRGAVVSVIFEATDISSSQREQVLSAISASYSSGASSASADAQYKNAIQRLQQTTNLSVKVFVQGGPGTQLLSHVVADPANLPLIRQSISDYISKVTIENAKPLTYETSPITQFKPYRYDVAPDLAQDRLIEIYDQYNNITDIVRQIERLIEPTGPESDFLKTFVPDPVRQSLARNVSAYESARDQLRTAGVACLSEKPGCSMPPSISDLPRISWPSIPPPPYALLAHDPRQPACTSLVFPGSPTYYMQSFESQIWIGGDRKLFKEAALIENGMRQTLDIKFDDIHTFAPYAPPNVFGVQFGGVTFGYNAMSDERPTQRVYGYDGRAQVEVLDIFGRRTTLELTDLIQECFAKDPENGNIPGL